MSKKIAIYLHNLEAGGAERMMINLAGGIADAGYAVDLVLVEAVGDYLTEVPKAVRIVDLKQRRTMSSIPALARYLRREKPVAVLSALMHVNVAALIAMRLAGRCSRLVISERTTISQQANCGPLPFSIRAAYKLVPWLYPGADGITTVSRGAAEDLARFCRIPIERIAVINNPVVGPGLLQRAAEPLDHPWFAPGEPPVILGVGRLNREKDFYSLIRAVASLVPKRPIRLVILGEGVHRAGLEALIDELGVRDRVQLYGFTPNPYAFMARAAALVLSSHWEGSPNVLVEAMACGTPVAATDCPNGPNELLEGGRYGPLVPVGDVPALAAAIEQVLDAPIAREDLKRRASMFTIEHATQAYLRVLLGEAVGNKQST